MSKDQIKNKIHVEVTPALEKNYCKEIEEAETYIIITSKPSHDKDAPKAMRTAMCATHGKGEELIRSLMINMLAEEQFASIVLAATHAFFQHQDEQEQENKSSN